MPNRKSQIRNKRTDHSNRTFALRCTAAAVLALGLGACKDNLPSFGSAAPKGGSESSPETYRSSGLDKFNRALDLAATSPTSISMPAAVTLHEQRHTEPQESATAVANTDEDDGVSLFDALDQKDLLALHQPDGLEAAWTQATTNESATPIIDAETLKSWGLPAVAQQDLSVEDSSTLIALSLQHALETKDSDVETNAAASATEQEQPHADTESIREFMAQASEDLLKYSNQLAEAIEAVKREQKANEQAFGESTPFPREAIPAVLAELLDLPKDKIVAKFDAASGLTGWVLLPQGDAQNPQVAYVTADAKHLLIGSFLTLGPDGLVNLTNRYMDQIKSVIVPDIPGIDSAKISLWIPKGLEGAIAKSNDALSQDHAARKS